MQQIKKYYSKKRLIYVILGILFIVLAAFSPKGYRYFKEYRNALKTQIERYDSLETVSKKRFDSILNIASDAENEANTIRIENDLLRQRNNNLYYELKRKARSLRTVDTVFISNAKRIAESSDRFYQEHDTIR